MKDDILKLEKVQDYRFGTLMKGRHYAFARGLTINPTHLPAALDAMHDDGWETMAVFGETDSEHVGFVFKRVPRVTALEATHGFGVQPVFTASNPDAERKWQDFLNGVSIKDIT